jgi:MOSC domain-containing protein YiiM
METQRLLDAACGSPKDGGVLELIILRLPDEGRQALPEATLSPEGGVEGDRWSLKIGADPSTQVSLINARFLAAIAGEAGRWELAGDNLIVDLDLHMDNLPAGTRLRIGQAVIEVAAHPHTGCSKFERHYGKQANDLTKTPEGRAQRLRGLYARVVQGGRVRVGDVIRRDERPA